MHNFRLSKTLAIAAVLGFGAFASAQTTFAQWNFSTVNTGPDNTPTPTTDLTSASATQLGMTNDYSEGESTAFCDVLATSGNTNPGETGNAWRIRGAGMNSDGTTSANGWAIQAPQYSQGAEFDASTVGYSNIEFSFDFYSTTQGIADLQLQYNTNINNSGGWTNYTGAYAGNVATIKAADGTSTLLVATSNNWNVTSTTTTNLVNLSGITGVANDANFGIRLVSAYNPTSGTYNSAAGGAYNNSSGNWRFDQITFEGTAAPELPSGVLLGLAGIGLILVRSRRTP